MSDKKIGRQIPTTSLILPYKDSRGEDAIELYESTGRVAQEWQRLMLYDLLAINEDGLWTHTKFGYSVPRRNGKNEIVAIREFWGIENGEKILHTAHRTTTSSSASKRLSTLLNDAGYMEVIRIKKGVKYEKAYTYSKQFGLERIAIIGGGSCDFRTRSSKGGLGEGFDLLVVDEAQEYQDDQESALKYVVTDSRNPQTVFCGTPPTAVSSGTVFMKLRNNALQGLTENTGWAEWSVSEQSDPRNRDLWYETNPSLGTVFTERSVSDEIGSDVVDFNIQRLGLWLRYNQKSAISKTEWKELKANEVPVIEKKKYYGIKFGQDGTNVALSVAVKTSDKKVFVECIDCRPVRDGFEWIMQYLIRTKYENVTIDGASGQKIIETQINDYRLKKPILPTVKEVIEANATFEQGLFNRTITHCGQPSVIQTVSNCEKRAIGTNGGFGYRSLKSDIEIAILDSIILAHWQCSLGKEKKKQRNSC